MFYLVLSILFYISITACLILWLVNYLRKVFLHWEYMKIVEGKFEKYQTYWDAVFSFDLNVLGDVAQILLPIYQRNPIKEKVNHAFEELGEKLKKVFWWGWGSFIVLISIQIIMLLFTIIFGIL